MAFTPNMPIGATSNPTTVTPTPKSDLPTVTIAVESLPSRSLSYPPSATIKYRPYTFGEVKRISGSKLSPREGFDLVASGIETSFPIEDLTLSDLMYLGFLRKISTLGTSKVMVPWICEKCGTHNKEVFDAQQKFEFEDLSIPELPLTATFDQGGDLSFSPLTFGKYLQLVSEGLAEDEISLMASQCVNLPLKEAVTLFSSFTGEDMRLLDEVDRLLYHGLKPLTGNCTQCKHPIKVELDGGSALFLPFRDNEKPLASRIRYGTKPPHQSN